MKAVLAFVALFLTAGTAHAGELRVLDQRGLVRAMRDVNQAATIKISVSGFGEEVTLINTDGISAPVAPASESSGPNRTLEFSGISSGTWRLKASSPLVVQSVTITE